MKQTAIIFFLLLFCNVLKSQTANIDFESTPVGTYTTANAVSGWTVSSQVNTSSVCNTSTLWTAGSPEFSIVSTPIAAFPVIGNILQSPLGGNKVARLNNSTANGSVTKLSRTYSVTTTNSLLKIAWAGAWEGDHSWCCYSSSFYITLKDQSGNLLSCVSISLSPGPGCTSYNITYSTTASGFTWANWAVKDIDLSPYINSVVSIEILNQDCTYSDHYGTVFIDADLPYVPPAVNYCGGLSPLTINSPAPRFFSYQWSTTVTNVLGTYTYAILQANSPTLQIPYANGTSYTLTNNSGGCIPTYVYSISPTSVNIGTVLSVPSCINGGSGTATVIGIGNGGGYNYSWINSTNSVVSTNSILSNAAPGSYSLTILAAGSASSTCGTASTVVTISSATFLPASVIQPFCGTEAYLGAPQGTNYQWYNQTSAITASAGGVVQNYIVNPAQTNDNFVVAYDGTQGCRDSINFILVSSSPGTISVSQYTPVCLGAANSVVIVSLSPVSDSPQGMNSFSITSVGTTPAFSGSLSPTSSLIYTASGLTGGGTYTISAFDGACTYSNYFTVSGFAFNFSITPAAGTLCVGSQTAFITFTSTPSLTQYSYSWSPSTFLGSTNTRTTLISPNVPAGSVTNIVYTVVVTSSLMNCPQIKTLSLTFANPAIPIISVIPPLCINDGPFTITANPGGGLFFNYINSYMNYLTGVITPTSALAGAYTFTYVNSYGPCSASSAGNFTINPLPIISVSGNTILCEGQSSTLLASGANTFTWSNSQVSPFISVNPQASTSYTVEGTDANTNCSNSKTVTVNVVPYPLITVIGNTLLCPGESASLVAMGAFTYSWSNGTFTYLNVVSPNTTTTYSVIGISYLSSCSSTAEITVVNSNCNYVGLNKINFETSISIYPNPTNGKVTIDCKETFSFVLIDGLGRQLVEEKYKEGIYALDLSDFPAGIYFLNFKNGNKSSRLKLIKTD